MRHFAPPPRLFRSCALVFIGLVTSCFFLSLSRAFAVTICPPQYLGNYPKEGEADWTDNAQGITHDDTHWYINRRDVIYRIPVARDLWQDQEGGPGVSARHLDDIPELAGYHHMGGSASFKYNDTWYILIPVDQGPADALCAVFRADASLATVGTSPLPGQTDQAGWFAVGPDGIVYSSVSFPTEIRKYSMNWSTIESGPVLTFIGTIPLSDENGDPYQLFHMQGGAVTPDNAVLYIANGLGDCLFEGGGTESDSFGLHAFDLATGQRIMRSCQSGCTFRFQYDLCEFGFPNEEPEGITLWDLDGGAAPGIRGQLHCILLDNDPISSDVYLKHYRLNGSAAGIACPEDVVVECTQPGGVPKSDEQLAGFFDVAALVGCDQGVDVSNDAPDPLPMGTTTVTFTASDATGTVATCSATITVVDTTPPVITCPGDAKVECNDPCGTRTDDAQIVALFAGVSATDVCDEDVDITNDAPECLPFGDTWVEFIATDDDGNADSCRVKVTVEDTTPPTIDVELDRDVLWPPNHKLVEVCAEVTVTDVCDPNPTFVLQSIVSDEPEDGTGDGNTDDDIQNETTGTPDLCYDLRSEHQGGGDGRTYTIVYCASDHSGNTGCDTVCVRVPHDQRVVAMASTGFNAVGTQLDPGAQSFAVIIPSTSGLDAASMDRTRIYLGNTRTVAEPTEVRVVDANGDGLPDLGVFFASSSAQLFSAGPFDPTREGGEGALEKGRPIGDGPVGIHFVSAEGVDCLVRNIYELGEPVEMPLLSIIDVPGPQGQGAPAAEALQPTGLTSIHPNPFNPETTVGFALASPERVRLAIYDVRGTLVKLLVDRTMPAGEHRATWNGTDERGRPASSGIYFVRMNAGSYRETKKVVMLK